MSELFWSFIKLVFAMMATLLHAFREISISFSTATPPSFLVVAVRVYNYWQRLGVVIRHLPWKRSIIVVNSGVPIRVPFRILHSLNTPASWSMHVSVPIFMVMIMESIIWRNSSSMIMSALMTWRHLAWRPFIKVPIIFLSFSLPSKLILKGIESVILWRVPISMHVTLFVFASMMYFSIKMLF